MHLSISHVLALAVGSLACLAGDALAKEPDIVPSSLLVLPRVGSTVHGILPVDPVQARLVAGTWLPPSAGETVAGPDGKPLAWETVAAGEPGVFEHRSLSGGYAYLPVPSETARVAILEASGHSSVWVNGEPRAGDIYGYGYVRLPVALKAGRNDFLFRAGRGRLQARLVDPDASVSLDVRDATLPDLHDGKAADTWGAAVVLNATDRTLSDLVLVSLAGNSSPVETPLPSIGPLTARKVGFRIVAASHMTGAVPLVLRIMQRGESLHRAETTLRIRKAGETYKRTFVSGIDGSVQYYAVNPSSKPGKGQSLLLSLHGASVEAIGQADAYSSKSWANLVAPTNRRPYGYDWEDWGRMDAMEVLDIARKELVPDPARVYLTGHSMGGHGTWQVGALYPGRFAAIGPSAGWISIHSYGRGGGRPEATDGIPGILRRSAMVGDTTVFARNYAAAGVSILHGDADDNVPVTEARAMREILSKFHEDVQYHEEPGQGHWWDLSEEPGADCVEWAPMMDFFTRRARPATESVRRVDFTTANPEVSAWCHWAAIQGQERIMQKSRVQITCDPHLRRFTGTTENVSRLALDTRPLMSGRTLKLTLDGQALMMETTGATVVHLRKDSGKWALTNAPGPATKGPRRYGPFRHAFNHRFAFVYGTEGTAEEKAWAYARARYDAETWWYRGNGSVDVLPDTAFDANKDRDRSVILYGNADTNRAWRALLKDSPVQVRRGGVQVGAKSVAGDGLAALFLRPRPGSDVACVGAVAGTGMAGLRLTESLPYLQPMVGFPDLLVVGADVLEKGLDGVRVAGFFGEDWGVETGDLSWPEEAR